MRRANRQQTTLPSSVLSADSMHIGILAAAAHASANRSSFSIFYNPRYLDPFFKNNLNTLDLRPAIDMEIKKFRFQEINIFQVEHSKLLRIFRACPSEFVIPLTKYRKALYGTQLSVGMRFGMMFETEESSKRR